MEAGAGEECQVMLFVEERRLTVEMQVGRGRTEYESCEESDTEHDERRDPSRQMPRHARHHVRYV